MAEDFFQEQRRIAMQALRNSVVELGHAIRTESDLAPVIRKHPLSSIAAAAAGGLAFGYMIVPPRRRKAPRKERPAIETQPKSEHHHFLQSLQDQVLHAITPMLRALAASAAGVVFHGAMQEPASAAHHNGQPQPSSPAPPAPEPAPF